MHIQLAMGLNSPLSLSLLSPSLIAFLYLLPLHVSSLPFIGPQQNLVVVKYSEGIFFSSGDSTVSPTSVPKVQQDNGENSTDTEISPNVENSYNDSNIPSLTKSLFAPRNGFGRGLSFDSTEVQNSTTEEQNSTSLPDVSVKSSNLKFAPSSGFPGINVYEEATSGSGLFANSNDAFAPSHVGLAVGGGYVVQVVNSAIRVFRARNYKRLTYVTPLNQFFNVTPYLKRKPCGGIEGYGDNLFDAKVLYDSQEKRFYVSVWGTRGPDSSVFPKDESFQLIAVSKTRSPLRGFFYYKYNTDLLDSGDLHLKTGPCPCYPDLQSIGFDNYGIHVSVNSYSLVSGRFVGAQIYSINKRGLKRGWSSVVGVFFDGSSESFGRILQGKNANISTRGGIIKGKAKTIQPATLVTGFGPDYRKKGTQYFLSTYSDKAIENEVEVWVLSNTFSLLSSKPKLTMEQFTVTVKNYSQPPPAAQKSVNGTANKLDTGKTFMQQVVYANKTLWGAFTTAILDPFGTKVTSGVYWVAISVDDLSQISTKNALKGNGIISVKNTFLFYPAITVGRKKAIIGFGVSSSSIYPSTGYSFISYNLLTNGDVNIAYQGKATYDGSLGLISNGGSTVSLYGDYFSSCVDDYGYFWFSGETVTNQTRVEKENWGTFVAKVDGN